jgi:hypothetical protein
MRVPNIDLSAAVGRPLFWFGGCNHEISQQPAYAIMNPLGDVKLFRGRI